MRRVCIAFSVVVFLFGSLFVTTAQDQPPPIEFKDIPIIPDGVKNKGSVSMDFGAGLAEDMIKVLSGIVIDRVEEASYDALNRNTIAGIEGIEKIVLPNGKGMALTNTKAYLGALGVKSIVAEYKPFLSTLGREFAVGIVKGFTPKDCPPWMGSMSSLIEKTIIFTEKEKSISLDAYVGDIQSILSAVFDEIEKGSDAYTSLKNGYLIAFKELVTAYGPNMTLTKSALEYATGLTLSLDSNKVGSPEREASLQFGKDMYAVYAYFREYKSAPFAGFVPRVVAVMFDLYPLVSMKDSDRALLELGRSMSLAVASGAYEDAAMVIAQLSEVINGLSGIGAAEKRGVSVLSSALQYGIYYAAAQNDKTANKEELLAVRTQVLKDFIANNADRKYRKSKHIFAIEGALGARLTFDNSSDYKFNVFNPYSLTFGLTYDWYWTDRFGFQLRLNALDLGSYLHFEDTSFALDEDINLASAFLPSVSAGLFYDCGVLFNIGYSFGILPKSGTGVKTWSHSIQIGASVPLFDFN